MHTCVINNMSKKHLIHVEQVQKTYIIMCCYNTSLALSGSLREIL